VPSSDNNSEPIQHSPPRYARWKSSALACGGRIGGTGRQLRSTLPFQPLRPWRTPHDCPQHRSSEKFPAVRGAGNSALKNNRAFAKHPLPRTARHFSCPKSDVLDETVLSHAFLHHLAQGHLERQRRPALSRPVSGQATLPWVLHPIARQSKITFPINALLSQPRAS